MLDRHQFDTVKFDQTLATEVSIEVDETTYDFGTLDESEIRSTGLNYFTVQNKSSFSVDIYISGTDMTGGVGWTLADDGNPGENIVAFKAGLDGDDYNVVVRKSEPFNLLKGNLGSGSSQKWGLRILAPTSFSDGVEKNGTTTLIGVAS